MPCEPFRTRDGGVGIVCTRGRRAPRCSVPGCRAPAIAECDALVPGSKSGTCDRRLCDLHRQRVGPSLELSPGVDFCPDHATPTPEDPMNAAQYEEMVTLLNDIAARLNRLEQRIGGAPAARPPAARGAAAGPAEGEVASDQDLDGPYGNPEIRRDPPRWTGPSFVGYRFSDAPPEYLSATAGFLDWKAREADKKGETAKGGAPKSKFIRLDAARARGWAERLGAGAGAKATGYAHGARPKARAPEPPPDLDDGEIPF